MKRIAYELPEGVWVLSPSRRAMVARGMTEDEFLSYMMDNDVPEGAVGASVVVSLPDNRNFRAAWSIRGDQVGVDMPKARLIHMDRIREARNEELAKQDIALKIAEDVDDPTEIAKVRAERQRLRDIPQTFDLETATTPQALDARWPVGLPRKR